MNDDGPASAPPPDPGAGTDAARTNSAWVGLATAPVPWARLRDAPPESGDGASPSSRVLFVRVIASRNFSGVPFWVSCSSAASEALAERARAQAHAESLADEHRLATLTSEGLGILRERMLLPEQPVSFPGTRESKRVFLRPERDGAVQAHALFGEVEHWTRIHTLGPSALSPPQPATPSPFPPDLPSLSIHDLAHVWSHDDRSGVFAHAEPWGFLMSDPAHTGTGLRFEAGLHLPALSAFTARPRLQQVARALAATGHELQPLSLREPNTGANGFFRLVSRGDAAPTAAECAAHFAAQVDAVLRTEAQAWAAWNDREADVLEDRMHRSLRILQEARRLEDAEMPALISLARAGVYAGVFPDSLLPRLETLRVHAQPFHVRALAVSAHDPDTAIPDAGLRAGLARRLLSFP